MKKKFAKILGLIMTIALLTSLLTVAAPAAALTQPQVAIAPITATIQAASVYSITFTAGTAAAAGDQIVIVFPAGGPSPANMVAANDVMIQALSGIGGGPIASTPAVYAVTGSALLGYTVTITIPAGGLGAGSLVGITLGTTNGVVNPATPGDYTLTVATQTAVPIPIEAAVTSAPYTINAPTITALPGVVLAYNSAGILMSQSNSIITGIAAAGVMGRVEVGPGTYDENAPIIANLAGQTIVATDPGNVIINDVNMSGTGGIVQITAAAVPGTFVGVTFDGFVINPHVIAPQADMLTIGAAATWATITNCTIASGTNSAINALAGGTFNTISNCTLTATGAIGVKKGVVAAGQVAITNTTIE
jgi:hypothetical protein